MKLLEQEATKADIRGSTALMGLGKTFIGKAFGPVERGVCGTISQRVFEVGAVHWGRTYFSEDDSRVYVTGKLRAVEGNNLSETHKDFDLTTFLNEWYLLGAEWTEEKINATLAEALRAGAYRAMESAKRIDPLVTVKDEAVEDLCMDGARKCLAKKGKKSTKRA